jgi:hypothetical protein
VEEENFERCPVTYEPIEGDYWERLQIMSFAGEEFDIFLIDAFTFKNPSPGQ